ncbi:hypothetical protein [Streptomyces goshikiensis]|uniref:hypothetical protein n=1 Tax=Streptomyces goshikiensis TaxID=1942 RepID=UPI0037A3382F
MERPPSPLEPPLLIVDEVHDVLQHLCADDRSAAAVNDLLTELVRQGRRPVVPSDSVRSSCAPHQLADFDGPEGIPVEHLPALSKPVVVIRDEMEDVLAAVDRELQAVRAEAAPRELTGSELLTEIARRGRRRPTEHELWMASDNAHRMSDFD